MKILDPISSKLRKYATVGIKIDRSDPTLIYEVAECYGIIHNKKYYPTFFSQVGAYQDNNKLFSLGFLSCSIYENGFTIS